ncbi:LysR substrate-binding domain-containing protein [Methylobacterium gregans]|uniref:HTH-type transcriptional regulator PerR n=1 Tax=Methylobacterium gregans TaxID=374424 RepID=A0AA37MBX0_9HYPH|nr:LysR substrate-binding domain-containing protein [Methylobacterium gregans]MDQ0523227.1 DNA-binding transcriptional LysR family regulator [Methylobacterium gregans]GJD80612.1 HTH-type transcriptional regulator PerR [Methylobacterium gregans]GLS53555.1 transcriptional regulator [Methylobacterium gregans]
MRYSISLSAFHIFEAAARKCSFKAAASELSLSTSAISHAIRKMEEGVGVPLFERTGQGVRLTSSGEILLEHASRAFEALDSGLDLVMSRSSQLLRLHCAPSFAAQWLTPRLARFLSEHPGIEVRLAAGMDYARFTNDDFDADIVYGAPRGDGLVRMGLGEEIVTPLCDRTRARTIRSITDLLGQTLIQSDNKQLRWPHWFEANGLAPPPAAGLRFDRSFLALAAAADGLGVALESTRLAEREIAAGRLVAPLAGHARELRYVGHHLVFPIAARRRAPLRAFARWLAAELSIPIDPILDGQASPQQR